ncbi:L-glyceraldehyde 3-phosphate reductase [Cryobacterium sp. TMT1-21]|uniref:L-glyceraldehyde 3-phosphate reductase n=1 Tax=Cryobacterium shii TaxID=1259235 RepID=A0AAQ2C9L6_9MICO|nr:MULTISPECIES: L-glyceraldehyde 3-phosphate reductase [Cryobacterium]TFC53153.1 L-glyceraldehyde 3-phosphate reductase [Cryobacterium shii]TFC87705.1 L-glyceraldehyde 3-phosphate reductase [Cryobacterium sp. TmT2-59]TFD10116.1 L-glyceraldehyde 3-phosphate reductase [Cryobacterium sp. TMT1-21]TFD22059.1 L-glyceraldehyde 3-phosphate reductase [Cryobacterium sp. TMT4-10]TFD39181.1 L-glyceraldehyde 3-phosphate reductase [Cryobacterium sp. TMT2-10]
MTFVPAPNRYADMTYRRTGRSGLKLPALSLGLWHNFGHERPIDTQRAILRRAFDLGVTHFDLANNYGPPPGSAETNFGRIFAEDFRPFRDEMIISSKAGYDMWPGPYGDFGSRKYLLSSLDASLGRLGLDYVDIFYSHRPDPETPIEETMGALASAVHQGKALYVGISSYTPEQTRAAVAALAEHKVPLLIHQPRYSMFDRHIEDGLFPVLDELGVGSIVFSPLAQGLLTDRYLGGSVPSDSRVATSRFLSETVLTDTYLNRARALNAIAHERGQTLAQLAVTWILRQRSVTSVLVGASSVHQLEQTVAALDAPALTNDEIAMIEPYAVHGTGLG